MNTNEKSLYEEFININIKYRHEIFDFIDKNCPIAPKKKTQVLYEKIKDFNSKNQDEIKERRAEILENTKLYDYSKVMIFDQCKRCNLCKYDNFVKLKKQLKAIEDDALSSNFKPEKALNNFIENLEYFNFKIERDGRGNFSFQKGDTLKQMICFSFIENLPNLLNTNFQKQNKYFVQIAKLLLVNNKFLKDLNSIKDNYFYPKQYEHYTLYQPKKEYKENFSKLLYELTDLRDKYNISRRWESYIIQGMLTYPIDFNGELVAPKDRPIPRPPRGEPGRMQIFEGKKKLPEEPILVGDESEDMVKTFAKKQNIKIKDYFRSKDYKQPLRNFDRNFRWYREYQWRLKDKSIKTKDSIFSEMFLNDIQKYTQDWQEPDYTSYLKNSDRVSEDSKVDIEIGGANRIKAVIYRLDNLVHKKEK